MAEKESYYTVDIALRYYYFFFFMGKVNNQAQ